MKVAIIGTGNVGSALGRTLTEAGHAVTFAARDTAKTRSVAADIGAAAADTPADAVRDADVAILAVPFGALTDIADTIRDAAAGKVVIDVSNPMKPDYSGLATAVGPSAAETVAEHLAGASVVKAFNTLFSTIQADPSKHGTTLDAFYATDDDDAADTIAGLLRSIGFRPVRTGGLAAARELEALALLNIRLQLQGHGDWQSTFVLVGAPAAATRSPELAGSRAA
jgi:8-hydroxy-5-deazaflavin:NADPH oxidoreductase